MEEVHEFYVVGDRVWIDGNRLASVAYFGEVDFASGDWVGAVLDEPTGNHNGKFHGHKYFQCAPNHGILVKSHRVSRDLSGYRSSRNSSRLTSTPVPTFQHLCETPERFLYDYEYLYEYEPSYLKRTGRGSTRRQSSERRVGNSAEKSLFTSSDPEKQSQNSTLNSRLEDLSRRIRASSESSSAQAPVFNFRPKRILLEEGEDKSSMSFHDLKKGDRVLVRLEGYSRQELQGILRYLGETDFAHGHWAGVELDTPEGKNDGSVMNRRYFYCPRNYGLFIPVSRVRKFTKDNMMTTKLETVRSTIKSPPPLASALYINSHLNNSYSDIDSMSPQKDDRRRTDYSSGFDSASPAFDRESLCNSTPDEPKHTAYDRKPLFDDREIDVLLQRSMQHANSKSYGSSTVNKLRNDPSNRLKSITHTFTSSKYDGNPTVIRKVEYL